MAGLMNGQPPVAPARPGAPAAPVGAEPDMMAPGAGDEQGETEMDDEQGEAVTPEEQAQYDAFVKNGQKIIYGSGKVSSKILKALDGDGDPISGLATVTVMVVSRLVTSAKEAGQEISSDVVMHGGSEILADLADLQKEAGIADLSDDEQETAFYKAVDMYRDMEQKTGGIDEAGLEEDFMTLMEANENGTLDDVVPGASKAAQRFEQRGMAAPEGAPPASPAGPSGGMGRMAA